MVHAQNIPPEIQLDIWQWLKHNIGMEASIVLLILLVAFLFLAAAAIKGLCTRKGNTNNIITTTNTTYKVADHVENVNIGTAPTYKVWRGSRLSERDWVVYNGNLDPYELAAGFRSTLDPAYITTDGYPQALIMRTSPRVYNRIEEGYDHEKGNGYALLYQKRPGAIITNEIFGDTKAEHDAVLSKFYNHIADGKKSTLPL